MKWQKEVSRDLIALGSIPFLVLYLTRIWMIDNYSQMFQISISVVFLLIVYFATRKIDLHISIMVVLAFFTSYFYESVRFSIFASAILLLTVYGAVVHLKRKHVYFGLVAGAIATLLGYLIPVPF